MIVKHVLITKVYRYLKEALVLRDISAVEVYILREADEGRINHLLEHSVVVLACSLREGHNGLLRIFGGVRVSGPHGEIGHLLVLAAGGSIALEVHRELEILTIYY